MMGAGILQHESGGTERYMYYMNPMTGVIISVKRLETLFRTKRYINPELLLLLSLHNYDKPLKNNNFSSVISV